MSLETFVLYSCTKYRPHNFAIPIGILMDHGDAYNPAKIHEIAKQEGYKCYMHVWSWGFEYTRALSAEKVRLLQEYGVGPNLHPGDWKWLERKLD